VSVNATNAISAVISIINETISGRVYHILHSIQHRCLTLNTVLLQTPAFYKTVKQLLKTNHSSGTAMKISNSRTKSKECHTPGGTQAKCLYPFHHPRARRSEHITYWLHIWHPNLYTITAGNPRYYYSISEVLRIPISDADWFWLILYAVDILLLKNSDNETIGNENRQFHHFFIVDSTITSEKKTKHDTYDVYLSSSLEQLHPDVSWHP